VTLACAEPNCAAKAVAGASRCGKGHVLRRCTQCNAHNRAFANFCRACAAPLPLSASSWTGYKGSARRLGFNAAGGPAEWVTAKGSLTLRLGDACRSLLASDGHLIAISNGGTIEIADPLRARSVCCFQIQGPVMAEPCISNGVLYVSTRHQITAYALGPMTLDPPRVHPLWQLPVDGTPLFALTPAGNRVFVTIATSDAREVRVIEQSGNPPRATFRVLHRAARMTWLAADPESGRAVFLSEDNARVRLHVAGDDLATYPVALQGLVEQPIAILGDAVFGIFGATRQLHRIDAATGAVEEPLENDTQLFALTYDEQGAWDRDGVRIDSEGVLFARSSIRDTFAPLDRAATPSPIIVHNAAAVVGMQDGRVLLYELAHPPRHEVWRLDGNSGAPITALASFDGYIAAGNRDGVVELCELREKGAPR
jgi:hypothetical protein